MVAFAALAPLTLSGLAPAAAASVSATAASVSAVATHSSAAGVPGSIRPAADLSLFRPGNIISDVTFFASSTMSAGQIQAFLETRVPSCQSGYTCLKDWTDTSRTVAADAMCGAYAGAAGERASQIIFKVAQACGINPRVLLVTLQKEQGLVTHTWPSEWRYTIAMGQGCPDTAACDTRYYGFFNQVYGAAWQFKRYANPPGTSAYFTWYAPGKTWNLRFNPNSACGSSPVYIENQATANLYYYTPYQPNAAALRAGYGEGDGCSAYGNRNFYNYFTDWFGSAVAAAESPTLVKSAASATVWIVSQGSRWSLADYSEWLDLSEVFGSTRTVTDAYLSGLTDRGLGGAIIRDAQTGSMALVQSGKLWGLSSCAAVTQWGGSCANPVNVAGTAYRGIPQGPLITAYARLGSGAQWGVFESASVRVLHGDPSAHRLNGGVLPVAPRMSPRAMALHSLPAAVYAPGELVRTPSDATVFMTDGFDRLIPLSSFATVRDMGLDTAAVRTVEAATLAAYEKAAGSLTPVLGCATSTMLPASGTLHPLTDPASTGWQSTALAPESCGLLTTSPTLIDTILLKSRADATVYLVAGGIRRALSSWSELTAIAGPSPRILTVEPAILTSLPFEAPLPVTGTLVKGTGPSVFIVDGQRRVGLPSFALARELGLSTSYTQLSDEALSRLTDSGVTASPWVVCSSATVFFAASGRLHAVGDTGGFTPAAFGDALCARLDRSGVAVDRVFVKGSVASVSLATGGAFSPIGSWSRLLAEAGGSTPTILRIDDAMMRTLPVGPTLP